MPDDPLRTHAEPFGRAYSDVELEIPPVSEVEFEEGRGVNLIEIRDGFAGIQVSELGQPLFPARMDVLNRVAAAGISIDFLKLTLDGLSFLIPEGKMAEADKALSSIQGKSEVKGARSVVLAHAANMRDEEGLIAQLVSAAIESGAEIEHLSDMHDRIMLVVRSKDAPHLKNFLRSKFGGAA